MKRTFLILMLVMLSVVGVFQYAGAADEGRTPFYVGAAIGPNWRATADDPASLTTFNKPGFAFDLVMGVRLEGVDNKLLQNLRFELEYSKQYNKIDMLELHPLGNLREKGSGYIDVESYAVVTYYDFPIRKLSPSTTGFLSHLSPYVGLGLGFNRSILRNLSSASLNALANTPISQGGLGGDGTGYHLYYTTDFVFGISPRFGVTYELSKHLEVSLGAKYMASNHVYVDAYGSYHIPPEYVSVNKPNVNYWDTQLGIKYNF
ncbi:secreted protein [Candidatus Magnetobacterium bavaricum]|uniref:Secreted protein n=1 Tax=Candidatus Magnetobacterium bavaricum TaxID=29290 RepID=A0A0F3GHZ9_9BACT|nr:secreted protein [Candidatus Magnetobacterium bavaricum]